MVVGIFVSGKPSIRATIKEVMTRATKVLSFNLTIMKISRITPIKTINNGIVNSPLDMMDYFCCKWAMVE